MSKETYIPEVRISVTRDLNTRSLLILLLLRPLSVQLLPHVHPDQMQRARKWREGGEARVGQREVDGNAMLASYNAD